MHYIPLFVRVSSVCTAEPGNKCNDRHRCELRILKNISLINWSNLPIGGGIQSLMPSWASKCHSNQQTAHFKTVRMVAGGAKGFRCKNYGNCINFLQSTKRMKTWCSALHLVGTDRTVVLLKTIIKHTFVKITTFSVNYCCLTSVKQFLHSKQYSSLSQPES